MDVDDCYSKVVGTIGRYQLWALILHLLYTVVLCPQTFLLVFVGALPSTINGTNPNAENNSFILVEWDLLDRLWLKDIIHSVFFVGFLFGVVIFGQLSDRFGRKVIMLAGFHMLFPMSLMTAYSFSWQTFAACRLVVGFVYGGTTLVNYVYTQEMLGRRWWPLTGLAGSASFALGIVLFSIGAYYVTPWRELTMIVAYIQIVPMLCLWSMCESPRWLYSKGRLVEAEMVLVKIAKKNGVKNPVVSLTKKTVTTDEHYSLIDLLKHSITRKRAFILSFLWFCNSLVYYALALAASDISDNLYLSEGLQGVMEYPAMIFCFLVLNRKCVGRKRVLVMCYIISGVSCLAMMPFENHDKTKGKLVLGLIGKMCIAACFSTSYIFTPELFPTVVRNVAIGSLSMCSRVGGIIASFSESLIDYNSMLAYALFGSSGIIAGLLAILLPETLGLKPPDSFADVDKQAEAKKKKTAKFSFQNSLSMRPVFSGFKKTKIDEVQLLVPSDEEET